MARVMPDPSGMKIMWTQKKIDKAKSALGRAILEHKVSPEFEGEEVAVDGLPGSFIPKYLAAVIGKWEEE